MTNYNDRMILVKIINYLKLDQSLKMDRSKVDAALNQSLDSVIRDLDRTSQTTAGREEEIYRDPDITQPMASSRSRPAALGVDRPIVNNLSVGFSR